MHSLPVLIKDLAIILGMASLVALLFQKIRQPIVLGYLVAGMIIGPYTPPHVLVNDIPNIKILSELGIIFLMFSLGLEFSFQKLKKVGFSASVSAFFEVFFMLAIGFLLGKMLHWSFYDSLFLGAALAISSTTIIIKALEELKLKAKHFSEVVFGILIVEDLLAILLLVALSTIVATNDIFSSDIIVAAMRLVLVVGSWFLIGYFVVPSLFRRIARYINEETLTIVSIALCLFLVCVANYFHYSIALGAFIMGSILAETALVGRIEKLVEPIRNIFAAVFFVSIGMLIDPRVIFENWQVVFLICAVTLFGKFLTTGMGAFLSGEKTVDAIKIGASMAQIGEFSFIIIALGSSLNVISENLYPIVVAVSAVTTFTTPYCIKLATHWGDKLMQSLPAKTKKNLNMYTRDIHDKLKNREEKVSSGGTLRFIINAVVVTIIFTLAESALPFLSSLLGEWSRLIIWLLTLLVASPFLWGMIYAYPRRRTRYLVRGIALLEVAILSIPCVEVSWLSLFCAVVGVLFFMMASRQLGVVYRWFEKVLSYNLQAEKLER